MIMEEAYRGGDMRCCSVGLLPSDASVEQTTRARLTLFDLRRGQGARRARESSAQIHRSIAACFRFSLWAMTVMF